MNPPNVIHPKTLLGIGSLALLSLLLNGCGGGYGGGSVYGGGLGMPPATTLTSIAMTPSSETITTGTTAKLTAIGNYSNGTTADISSSVSWSSAAPATASVVSPGVVTGARAGTTTVTASMNNGTLYNVSATGTITVTDATLTNITIAPPTMQVAKGATTTFTATGTFSDSSIGNVSGMVTWSSSDTTVATVNASGMATGMNVGTCTITASSGGISNIATVTVF